MHHRVTVARNLVKAWLLFLIPLQNIASLHCSSRCDAPEPDWPPQGLAEDEPDERDDEA